MDRKEDPQITLDGHAHNSLDTLRLALKMKWVMGYELRRMAAYPVIRFLFACHGLKWGKRWRIWAMP